MTDIQLAQNGDTEAFGRLITRYRNAATAVALRYLRSVAWSEDIAQDAFVKAWRALPGLRNPDSFGPWLLQLVRRQALSALRDGKRKAQRELAWDRAQGDPERVQEQEEAEALIVRALEQVPDDARER